MMNGWQWYESISKALEMSPCLFNWSPFQAIPGNPPPPPLSEVIDQNNNGSGGECNCHLTSTRLTIIPPQKNTTFVIQENWNQIGNELDGRGEITASIWKIGIPLTRCLREKLAPRDRGCIFSKIGHTCDIMQLCTGHCNAVHVRQPGCKGGNQELKQRMWWCGFYLARASTESSRGLRIQYI